VKDIFDVHISESIKNGLRKIPVHIVKKLQAWVDDVGHHGLREIRKIPGYHDEPLKGKRAGQRSIRLNKAYRAIYTIEADDSINFVEIREVNKHDY
jgi:toxin HigB-1